MARESELEGKGSRSKLSRYLVLVAQLPLGWAVGDVKLPLLKLAVVLQLFFQVRR
jgi:hypothetical protein